MEVYVEALRRADDREPDSVHDAIALAGPSVLTKGVPYLVQAARWRLDEKRRTHARRKKILTANPDFSDLERDASLDPYERLARNKTLERLLQNLATLPERDLLAVWLHMDQVSDEEILEIWRRRGVGHPSDDPRTVARLRAAALGRLRRSLRDLRMEE